MIAIKSREIAFDDETALRSLRVWPPGVRSLAHSVDCRVIQPCARRLVFRIKWPRNGGSISMTPQWEQERIWVTCVAPNWGARHGKTPSYFSAQSAHGGP